MRNHQPDIEILTNSDELSEFRSRQIANLMYYKKATRRLNLAIKEINNRIEKYKIKTKDKEPSPEKLELYMGFNWYLDQDEIWEFVIEKNDIDSSNMANDKVLENLRKNCKKLIETFKRCENEKTVIKEEISYLDSRLHDIKSENGVTNTKKELKIDFNNQKLIKKKNQIKFFNDFSFWEAQKLVKIDIPYQINTQLDKVFQDDVFLFQEYQTYDRDILDDKRKELFDKVKTNIRDYTLKEFGDITIEKVKELIDLQLLVLLKSYKKYLEVAENSNKSLKKLAKETCESLINKKIINNILNETKSNKTISILIIPELEKKRELTPANKRSISDYFRKGELLIRKNKNGVIICTDTYPRIRK